jgi:cation diffusion facilitator family transporter
MAGNSRKAVIAALLANGGIAVAKFAGFAITRSASMLAEGVHSVADTGNQGLLLLGSRRGRKAATPEHPFGYGRERYFWSFIVALVLFTLGGVFAIYEGVEKIRHPHELDSPQVAIGILLFGLVLEGFSFRTAVIESNKTRGDASWIDFIRRTKVPELPVVLLEDLGAMIGLVMALGAISLSIVTDDPVWDGYGSLSIGILLCLIAAVLAVEMKSLLIGESASESDRRAIQTLVDRDPRVRNLIHMRTEHVGPDELLIAMKVEFERSLTVEALTAAVNDLESALRAEVVGARIIYIEPDITAEDPSGG